MGWLGKLVGGTVGFTLGGPLGAVLGTTFGHAFDSESELNQRYKEKYIFEGEQHQLTFFVASFSMLAKLANTDGKVSSEEIKSIKKFISEDLKLTGYSSRVAVNIFNSALKSPQTFSDFAHQFYSRFYDKPQMLELMIDIMLRVSIADGHISHKEEELLIRASNIFNFSQIRYNRLKSKYVNSNINSSRIKYYSVLGCKETDSNEYIKSCYRKRVHEYHPDKIVAKGLPEEFNKFAQNKFREIQEAWNLIKKERMIK